VGRNKLFWFSAFDLCVGKTKCACLCGGFLHEAQQVNMTHSVRHIPILNYFFKSIIQ